MNVAIIGGGPAGLSAGYELTKRGISVHVFERDTVLGGLAGSFELGGGYVERYYHFICLQDRTYISILRELRLDHLLRWTFTDMAQFIHGALHSFGRPLDLLRFPYLSFVDKLRFGANIMRIKAAKWERWKDIEDIPAEEWMKTTFGEHVFHALHEPLIRLKFGEHRHRLSAAWMWARIHRLGKSRTMVRQREKVGYVDGGSQVVMDALGDSIRAGNGKISLGATVEHVIMDGQTVKSLIVNGEEMHFDAIVSTVPLPVLLRILPASLQEGYWAKLRSIDSIGVLCVLLRTSRPLTKYFWTNISDPDIDLAGIIEYTNLNPLLHLQGDSIIYLPQYLPSTAKKFRQPDDDIIREYTGYLKRINPDFRTEDIKEAFVFRDTHAQAICEVGFTKDIPAITSPIEGFFVTDSSQLHPDDRTISNSLGLGQKAAACVAEMARRQ